ncbi:uncharacterized protein PG986_005083 [Apiospora aurea]|uniref:Cytochrome P450 n=1 Tax=Apiospora aurea TaxID=335848 RepID=A0ABR1QGI6_9PEZI
MPSLISLPLAVAAVCVLLLAKHLWTRSTRLRLPPGPKPLPLVGNLHQVPKSLQWLHFYHWSREYGPVMHLSMAGQSLVILSTNQAAQDLLSRRSAQYSDRPRMVMSGELVTKGMHMLLRQYDAQYKLHQRMEAPLLNMKASNCYRPVQEMESRQLLFDIIEDTKIHGDRGIDFHHHFERDHSGYRLRTGHEQSLQDAKRVQAEFARTGQVGAYLVDSFPVLNHLPACLAPWKKEGEQLYQLERNLHVGNLEGGLANPGWNFSKHMRGSAEARGMSTEELAFDLGIVADAALDTSTVAMDWLVVACITAGGGERGFVAKAQADLDRVVGRERLPTFEDRARLPYIDAIVCEVLRWRPVVVGGVPHATKREDKYMGYRIPAGSLVMGNHYAITRDESVFGPDVDAFQPERWLQYPEKANPSHYSEDVDSISHAPCTLKDLPQTGFGFGRRVCTGRNIARNGLFIQAARLLWAFNVEAGVVNDLTGERRRVDDMDCTEGFVTMPKPFQASFRPRGDWVREMVEARCDTHGEDFVGMLDRAGRERRVTIGKE